MGELVDRDQEHLLLAKWGFYLTAGTIAFFSLFAMIYIVLGVVFAFGSFPPANNPTSDTRQVGMIFLGVGSILFLFGLVAALLTYWAGRCVGERRRRMFCVVIAGLCCLQVPFGTALGVCTILVLNRPSVKVLFEPPGVPAES